MLADLHVHSIYSDGWYTPKELCRRAKARGLSLLSVTDHDTLAGEADKRAAAKEYGLQYLTGWEISAYDRENKMHVLGYGCQLNAAYHDFMETRKRSALLRAKESVEKLQGEGVEITLEGVLSQRSKPDLPVHTMHIARAAAKALSIPEGEAYLRYLAYGKIAHSLIGRPSPKEAIDCIHACGGIAVLAHPGRILLSDEEKETTVISLAKEGLDGIEGVYTTHTQRETEYFRGLAARLGLLVTGGSDTHFEEESHRIGLPRFTPSEELLAAVKLK